MSIEIKSRRTGDVIKTVEADTLQDADLRGADLEGADLRGAKRHMDGDTAITLVGQRPILQLGPLGSRNGYIMALRTSAGLRIECGCFCGTDKEFSAAVNKTHAENPRHLKEYLAAWR